MEIFAFVENLLSDDGEKWMTWSCVFLPRMVYRSLASLSCCTCDSSLAVEVEQLRGGECSAVRRLAARAEAECHTLFIGRMSQDIHSYGSMKFWK